MPAIRMRAEGANTDDPYRSAPNATGLADQVGARRHGRRALALVPSCAQIGGKARPAIPQLPRYRPRPERGPGCARRDRKLRNSGAGANLFLLSVRRSVGIRRLRFRIAGDGPIQRKSESKIIVDAFRRGVPYQPIHRRQRRQHAARFYISFLIISRAAPLLSILEDALIWKIFSRRATSTSFPACPAASQLRNS